MRRKLATSYRLQFMKLASRGGLSKPLWERLVLLVTLSASWNSLLPSSTGAPSANLLRSSTAFSFANRIPSLISISNGSKPSKPTNQSEMNRFDLKEGLLPETH